MSKSVNGFQGFDRDVEAVNWNRVSDPKDLEVWNRAVSNFWLPEKISLSDDLPSWAKFAPIERITTVRDFAGLTLLDTFQMEFGLPSLIKDGRTPHERAVYANFDFMEGVHAKSYSSVFATLCSTKEIDEAYEWSRNNPFLQKKVAIIRRVYESGNCYQRKIASVFLESFLFYSGFYLPMYFASRGSLAQTADLIHLIIRDEAIHGYYIGYKFQREFAGLSRAEQDELREYATNLFFELYQNEVDYTRDLYDPIGWTEEVIAFLHYNGNKAMANLGFAPLFPEEIAQVDAGVLASLSPTSGQNHDFFSLSGATYQLVTREVTMDVDFE